MYVLSARRRTCRQDLRFARTCLKKNFCGIKYNIIQKSSARGRRLIFVPGIMLSKIKNIINIVIKENAMENKLTHFDENGNAVMVDVSDKPVTHRTAIATGAIQVGSEIMEHLTAGTVAKGDVLGVARVAGIMSVKHTSDLVPMCHPLSVTKCAIDFELEKENGIIRTFCTVKTDGKTGVEMEALTGVQVTLLTIYDMCKAIDKHMVMTDIHLVEKTGGKSGDFLFKEIKNEGEKNEASSNYHIQ